MVLFRTTIKLIALFITFVSSLVLVFQSHILYNSSPLIDSIQKQRIIEKHSDEKNSHFEDNVLSDFDEINIPVEHRVSPLGHFMYGYYDKQQTIKGKNGINILMGKIPFYNREPGINDAMLVGWVSKSNPNKFNIIGNTTAWNLQQGCMMEWINETHVIYNVRQNGFKALISDLHGNTVILPFPVYALGHKKYISVAFDRLHRLRRGYGYTVPLVDIEKCPKTEGIHIIDVETQTYQLLFSMEDIKNYLAHQGSFDDNTNLPHKDNVPLSNKYYWWVNHVMWSRDKKYISFITRASTILHGHSYMFSALLMAKVDTKELWRVPKLRGSHPYFGSFLLDCESTGTYKIIYKSLVEKLKWQPNIDGHCSLSPDEKWILTDTYPVPKKKIIVEELNGDRQFVLGQYSPHSEGQVYTRCDLHPRWSFDGTFIVFDSTHEGDRCIYYINISQLFHESKKRTLTSKTSDMPFTQNRYVFVDLGARNGDTIDWYIANHKKRLPSEIWAFEANPQNFEHIEKYKINHPELNLHVIKKAAWIDDNGVEFSFDNRPGTLTGGSIFNHNQPYLKGTKRLIVESIDFSKWLLKNTNLNDNVMIKMDIEGAEYDVLTKMIIDNSIKLVRVLIVEWHDRFMPRKSHKELMKTILKSNISVINWH